MLRPLTAFHKDLYKTMHGKGLLKDFRRISTRSSYKDVYKVMQGNVVDLTRTPSRSSHKDLGQIFMPVPLKRISQDLHPQDLDTRTSQEPPTRAFIQAPLIHGICETFMQEPPGDDPARIATRSSVKDLSKIMQGPFKEDFTRITTKSCHKDLRKIMQGPLREWQQDLHKIFSFGPEQENARTSYRISSQSSQHLLTRTSTRPGSRSSYITGL